MKTKQEWHRIDELWGDDSRAYHHDFSDLEPDLAKASRQLNKDFRSLKTWIYKHKIGSYWWKGGILGAMALAVGVGVFAVSNSNNDIRQQAAGCSQDPVNVQFRKTTNKDNPWFPGSDFKSLKVGDKIDVNCFSKNGYSLLSGGKITATLDGKKISVSTASTSQEIRGYKLAKAGKYVFSCSDGGSCSDKDSITVTAGNNTNTDTCADNYLQLRLDGTNWVKASDYSGGIKLNQSFDARCYSGYGQEIAIKATKNGASWTGVTNSGVQLLGLKVDVAGSYEITCTTTKCNDKYTTTVVADSCVSSIADLNKDCKVNLLDYDVFLNEFVKYKNNL